MVKNIIVQPSDCISIITEYFDFNQINYQKVDLWSTKYDKFGGYQLPADLLQSENNLLILSHDVVQSLINWDIGKNQLVEFSKKNYIWLWNDADGLVFSQCGIPMLKQLAGLNTNNVTIFVDGKFIINDLSLNILSFPINDFLRIPRIKLGYTNKINCKYDFLLTTIIKPEREHRDVLIADLFSRPISSNGLISKNPYEFRHEQWVGDTPHQHEWKDGFPSMDLYRQCWFEIVPETTFKVGHFYTEKTNKPIATKTPFLTVSTKGYLEYLRSLGFKTFDSLINESYDQQDAIEDRVRLMLDQAEDIIANGSEQFYHAAMPILDHNYNHLAEITGKWDHLMDAFITQQLERIGFKL